MNQSAFRNIIMLGFFLAVTCVSASAQSLDNGINVKIPFDFTVGEYALPAGKYTIKHLRDSSNMLAIQSADGQKRAVLWPTQTETRRAPANTALMFNDYGDQHILAEVWVSGDMNRGVLAKSRIERNMARNASPKTNVLSFDDGKREK